MSFRDNLREILEFLNLEQKELAAKTGLSLKTIENYVKKDSSIPSADKAVLIAQALGVTVEELVLGSKSTTRNMNLIYSKYKKLIGILEKLDDYNYEVIASVTEALLEIQKKKKTIKKI